MALTVRVPYPKVKTKVALPWASLISGAASIFGGLASAKGIRRQNLMAAQQAQKQMDFQERMSSTAHQREVVDLRAAGLNPILSGTGGAGASSPGGAMAPVQEEITPAINTAVAIRRANAEVSQIKASTQLTGAQTHSAKQSRNESIARTQLIAEQERILKVSEPFTRGVQKGASFVERLSPKNIDYSNLAKMLGRDLDKVTSSAKSAGALIKSLPSKLHQQLLDWYSGAGRKRRNQ